VNSEALKLPLFQQYQQDFTAHIRNPTASKKPAKVAARRMQVYTEIVFNNLDSSVSACFPVASKVLGKRVWTRLIRDFFVSYQSRTPLFRQIPEEFLNYLGTLNELPEYVPAFLPSLAHYEWIELAVSVADVMDAEADANGDLLDGQPVFAASLSVLSYDYQVQLISPRFKPDMPLPQPVNLLVFRARDDNVRFIELNPVTARLILLLKDGGVSGRIALEHLAAEMGHADPANIIQFGHSILQDLKAQGSILGTAIPG